MNLLWHIAFIAAAYFAIALPLAVYVGRWIRGPYSPPSLLDQERAASQTPAPGSPLAAPLCPQGVEPLSPAPGLTPRTLIATIPIYGHRRQLIAAAELYGCDCYVIRAHNRRVIYRWWCEGHGHFARWEKELVQ